LKASLYQHGSDRIFEVNRRGVKGSYLVFNSRRCLSGIDDKCD
jgi:hypothetical protein